MKKVIYKVIIALVVILLSILAMVPINKNYEINPWMMDLSDNTIISEMTIPGTHDSGAMHSIFDVAGKCQDLRIKEQLKVGNFIHEQLVVNKDYINNNIILNI